MSGVGQVFSIAIGQTTGTIGSYFGYIGAYLDPVNVYGPRITDASRQTSTTGVPLPFGYGTFTTAGNVIWSDDLKEHVKRQRQGKGGTTKTTTYTYTRSYAIGVCEGPIYGFLWIKRNGKTVYTTDPNAPIEDQKYSAEWIKRAAIYNGDELQMPDSTIEAVEGVGNVAPFRGLAYLVIENEDLTELAGAIPQYEFCVRATPPEVYLTSKPYPFKVDDAIALSLGSPTLTLREIMKYGQFSDDVAIGYEPFELVLKDIYNRTIISETLPLEFTPTMVTLSQAFQIGYGFDEITIGFDPEQVLLKQSLITYSRYQDEIEITFAPTGVDLI